MRWRWLLLPLLSAPAALQIACSATNGDSIPSEVRDAEALDANTVDPTERDSSSTNEDEDTGTPNPPKDGGGKDAPADAPIDAPLTSTAVRINEVYVERTGAGAKAEYLELRGPAGVDLGDLAIRIFDATGTATASSPYPIATAGQKMPASGVWSVGGFLANVDTIISIPQGWDLSTKGAIELVRGPSNTVIDTVGWTTDADAGASAPKGEGKAYVLPSTGTKSFGRAVNAADTNDNKTDFCTMAQTAKAANAACE